MNTSEKAKSFNQNFKQRLTRQQAASLAACAHCGMCSESCHYFLATNDPTMTPAYKADRIRRVATRISCRASISSPRRVPGSL